MSNGVQADLGLDFLCIKDVETTTRFEMNR